MLSGWMLYCVLVSGLLLGAARVLEYGARRVAMPQRWIWAGTLTGSILLPLFSLLRPRSAPAVPGEAGLPLIEVPRTTDFSAVIGTGGAWDGVLALLPRLDPVLLGAWVGMSIVLLSLGVLSALRLRRAKRGWEPMQVRGRRVLVSESTGPAVVGILNGAIVLPRWAISSDRGLDQLMLAHEEEHLRERDPLLLHSAALLVALLPWNLPLWWQLRRLRLAVEIDCDARVLRRGSDLRDYATLLLEVGRRRAGLEPAMVAFAEPVSFLERRLRIMTARRGRRGWVGASGSAALAAALVAGACAVEQPSGLDPEGSPATGAAAAPQEPGFSPRDTEPSLTNAEEFRQLLEEAYPPLLRDAGIGGRVLLWVYVNEQGGVADTRIYESSGYEQIDQAALRAMAAARFSPAQLEGRTVPVWIALPVQMGPPSASRGQVQRSDPPPAPSPAGRDEPQSASLSDGPAFTPREVEPRLANPTEFTAALGAAYPPALKDAGISGQVLLWIFVNEAGRVGNVQVGESSGYQALDEAAADVMREVAQFTPARNRGEVVPVWIAVPLRFQD